LHIRRGELKRAKNEKGRRLTSIETEHTFFPNDDIAQPASAPAAPAAELTRVAWPGGASTVGTSPSPLMAVSG
jgi:hypothetical protein